MTPLFFSLGYIQNVEGANEIQKAIFDQIELALASIEKYAARDNQAFFSMVQTSFQHIMLIMIVATIVGVGAGVLLSGTISTVLTRTNKRVSDASDQLVSSAEQVSSASQSLAESSSEQAASMEETSSSMEEMSSMTKQNALNAGQADSLMKHANQGVAKANKSMGELTTSIAEITEASKETSKIIKTIDEIAFQTNLLALNAAVEAARAGEAGSGFAVVAGEVRNLAMRAAEAAKNTADLIEKTLQKVQSGWGIVTGTRSAFEKVAGDVAKVGELVAQIAAASNEQADGITQINKAMANMDAVVQNVARNAEESASASEEMSAQATQMRKIALEMSDLVNGYKRNGNTAENKKGTKKRASGAKYDPIGDEQVDVSSF